MVSWFIRTLLCAKMQKRSRKNENRCNFFRLICNPFQFNLIKSVNVKEPFSIQRMQKRSRKINLFKPFFGINCNRNYTAEANGQNGVAGSTSGCGRTLFGSIYVKAFTEKGRVLQTPVSLGSTPSSGPRPFSTRLFRGSRLLQKAVEQKPPAENYSFFYEKEQYNKGGKDD